MILSGSASASIFAERSRSWRPKVAWKLRVLPRSSPPLGLSLRKRSSYKPATPSPNALLYSPANLPRHPKMDALGQSNSGSHPPSAFAGSRNCPPRGAGQSEIAEEKFLPPTREKPACSCLDTSPAASHHSNRVLMKILCFTPLPYGDGSGWWSQDLALTKLGFRKKEDCITICNSSFAPSTTPLFSTHNS